MSCRLTLFMFVVLLGASCDDKPPEPPPLGPETCTNAKDDNGDGKIDCLDPKCFQDSACRSMSERCDNDIDDNGDSLTDCADPMCAGQACGFSCTCIGGMEVTTGNGGGTGGSAGGGSGGGSSGGGTGGSSGGGTGGSSGGGTGGSSGGGTGGGTGGSSGGGTGGSSGGGSGGGASGGGSGGGTSGGGAGGGGSAATETNCNDNIDNDGDNATDCDDSNCVGVTCGQGCVCALNRRTEVNCSDGVNNDGDGQIDCADSDCFGAGTELCNDGVDNDCDRAIDCGDSSCTGNAQCSGLQDGKPCLLDAQCAGQECLTEAETGIPNGTCTNLNPCTPGTTTGCNGGLCRGSPASCYARCTGTGISGTGACRAGFICTDMDSNPSNGNNYCTPACSSSTECSGSGSGYGCNPWSKRCGNTDRGLGRYGAACSSGAQCETGLCVTGPDFPGGYCFGICRGDTENCGSGGICNYDPAQGDNFGICFQSCVTSSNCRQLDRYNCWGPATDPFGTCRCLGAGEVSGSNCDLCCSGFCSFSTCD